MGSGGEVFSLPVQVASCPVPRSLWMHRVRSSLFHNSVKWTVQSSETCLLFWEAQGETLLFLGTEEAWAFSGHCQDRERPRTQLVPAGEAAALSARYSGVSLMFLSARGPRGPNARCCFQHRTLTSGDGRL